MGGLKKICKYYGRMEVTNALGETVVWVYDYANDKPRIKSEMTKAELHESNKAKFKERDKKEDAGWDSWYKNNVKK